MKVHFICWYKYTVCSHNKIVMYKRWCLEGGVLRLMVVLALSKHYVVYLPTHEETLSLETNNYPTITHTRMEKKMHCQCKHFSHAQTKFGMNDHHQWERVPSPPSSQSVSPPLQLNHLNPTECVSEGTRNQRKNSKCQLNKKRRCFNYKHRNNSLG